MKTVFTNNMVAHVWAQQNQSHGRSSNGQFFFDGPTIYSYRRSYPIGHFTGVLHEGKQVVLFQRDRYSHSTSQHLRLAESAVHDVISFSVPCLSLDYGAHEINISDFNKQWEAYCDGMVNPKKRVYGFPVDTEEQRISYCQVEYNVSPVHDYCAAFGLPVPVWDVEAKQAAIRARYAKFNDPKRAKARERSQSLKEIALQSLLSRALAHKEGCHPPIPYKQLLRIPKDVRIAYGLPRYISKWEAGHNYVWDAFRKETRIEPAPLTIEEWYAGKGSTSYHWSTGPYHTLLRRKGETVETSQGARVPFEQAVRLYQFAQNYREGNWSEPFQARAQPFAHAIGHFTLDRIEANGDCKVGCHHLAFEEMRRLAVQEVPHLVRATYPLPVVVSC